MKNRFNIIISLVILLGVVLSFFSCGKEMAFSPIDSTLYFTGNTYGNAEWVIVFFSVPELIILFINKKWAYNLSIVLALICFLITIISPLFYVDFMNDVDVGYPSRTLVGYMVLAVFFVILMCTIIRRVIKKKFEGENNADK